MVQWAAATEVAREAGIFTKLIFCLFGVYVWEIFQTSDFEWSLITRKRKFCWPLSESPMFIQPVSATHSTVVIFFLCRYCMLFALVGLIVALDNTSPIDCNALYTFNSWTGNMAILCASTSLMIRTAALWGKKRPILVVLGLLALAHWAILWRGMFIVEATYSPEAKACVIESTNHVFLNISFFTTMAVDLTVLLLTVTALAKNKMHTHLWKLLFQDGLIYFCVTFFCNAVPAILNVLNLNTLMDVIATIPAATISCIAACRLVMRLQNHANNTSNDVYVHTSAVLTTPNHARFSTARRFTAPEIHVTTDSITIEDFPAIPARARMTRKSKLSFDIEHDAEYEK